MRLLLALAILATPAAAQDAFDTPGVDRHDQTPEWNYRRGESGAKGAYYDGGRYGPRGLLTRTAALDPWLVGTRYASLEPAKANRAFRRHADRNRDARLTDAEIGAALGRNTRR